MSTAPKTPASSSGYRQLKRVLGETNLERKCRWLFGICLLVLISIAFWWVDRIAERLVHDNITNSGREWARTFLFEKHWAEWDTSKDPKTHQFRQEMTDRLIGVKHESKVIALDRAFVSLLEQGDHNRVSIRPGAETVRPRIIAPEGSEEEELLRELKREFESQLAAVSGARAQTVPSTLPAAVGGATPAAELEPLQPVVKMRDAPNGGYYFYRPVHWDGPTCVLCHSDLYGRYSMSAADTVGVGDSALPFLVVRVTLDYAETRAAIAYTRAVLLAVGILTVTLAMIALWVVVRYVVVKPLNHLREVSDSVTRGDLDQRADIHTNDEFEELAASFNKMLRHLMETQHELRGLNTDLDGKVDELAQLNMRLHEMNRLKGEFLATMSHELRTPLNSIIGFSDVLQGIDSFSDKQKRYVQNIQTSGRRLLEMINDILDLAKMEAGKMDLRLSEFRADVVIGAQCDMVRSLTEEKNIDLRTEIEADLPLLYQDQAKVQQILTNLLSNAIKFTPEGGRITVGARGDSRGFIEMYVADTGVGIAESEREVIFEKFRQSASVLGQDNLTREYSGTGLGLSIVKELCKLLGGEVSVESELGKGSTFRVLIPWMRADRPQAATTMNAKLDDLTKPRRVDFQRGVEPGNGAGETAVAVGSASDDA